MELVAGVRCFQRALKYPFGPVIPLDGTKMAEGEGFEPPVVLPTLVFKTSALNRSAILPKWSRVSDSNRRRISPPLYKSGAVATEPTRQKKPGELF